jgi:error-prone DNA polymerase
VRSRHEAHHVPYAELHALSTFSFRRGASTPETLLRQGRELGLTALAITDRDGLYGSVRQWLEAKKADEEGPVPEEVVKYDGVGPYGARRDMAREAAVSGGEVGQKHPAPRPIYGSSLTLMDGSRVVALVRNRDGWRNLSALITESRMSCEKGDAALPFERLVGRKDGLTILSGGRFGPVDRALLGIDGLASTVKWKPKGPWRRPIGAWVLDADGKVPRDTDAARALRESQQDLCEWATQRDDPALRLRRATETAARFRDAFGDRFFLEVQDHRLPEDQWLRGLLGGVGEDLGIPRVATNLVHYALGEDRRLQDVLACVRLRTTLRGAGTRLLPNAHFRLKSGAEMAALFHEDPSAVAITVDIAQDHDFDLTDLPYAFPIHPTPSGHTLQTLLEEQTWEGAAERYGERLDTDPRIKGQIRHELNVIGRMGLAGYFLIVQDISLECRRRGILSQGRGSAANSCVCYCLCITAVDPIRLDLLFERFLSEARGGFPDIDIDISNSKREEVLQFVYEKYGRDHCAMVCNVITYHPRSAVRDVGKAFGLGLDQVDRMAKALSHYGGLEELEELFGGDARKDMDGRGVPGFGALGDDPRTLIQVIEFTRRLCGYPRHIGIHSGGVVISGVPIGEACPTENATMIDRTVLQWDKDDVAHTGLVKIDLLALGMLSVIQESARLLALRGIDFDMAQLTCDDPAVYDMICEGDTVGLFQIESRAQMNTLPRLRPRSFHDLVVEVALIRPGPIQGEMVHPYVRRRQGKEPIEYAHPSLRPILERTLGIPLFQEQAMKMAITAAGFTPAEADRLRKVMGFKRASDELDMLVEKMVRGMEAGGFTPETARRVKNQLRGFAAYGFPESHAASFALIVYASAHLKKFRAPAFFAGLLNCQPMGFYSPATLVGDARRHGVRIEPVCANRSDHRWTLHGEAGIRGGFLQVTGLGEEDGRCIEEARRLGGPFRDVSDFGDRCNLDRSVLEKLAEAGAFTCFGLSRREALWTVAGWRRRLPLEGLVEEREVPMFVKLGPAQLNLLDHSTAGYSAEEHPLIHLRPELAQRRVVPAKKLLRMRSERRVVVGGVVITRQRPGTAKGVFFITLEDETGFVNVVVWKDLFDKHRRLLRAVRFLEVRGTLQVEDGVANVLAKSFVDLEQVDLGGKKLGWDTLRSRDFH